MALYCEKMLILPDENVQLRGNNSGMSARSSISRVTESDSLNGGYLLDPAPAEKHVAMLVTDYRIYFIYLDDIPQSLVFRDAFVPTVHHIHELLTLRSISIFFGFQRCALSFCDAISKSIYTESFYERLCDMNDSSMDVYKYVVLSR